MTYHKDKHMTGTCPGCPDGLLEEQDSLAGPRPTVGGGSTVTCCHHWLCGESTFEGNISKAILPMVTPAVCKWCGAKKEHRVEYRSYEDFAVGNKPLLERLGVW